MPEQIRFKSPEELKEEEIERRIKERGPEGEILGGIVFEEETDPEVQKKKRYIYIGNPYEEDPTIIRLETDATREDIEAIKKDIIPTKEAFEILEYCARSYKMRHGLILEGPTAVGKTFLVEKFTELLYGRGVKPLDFFCSGQTDVSELMARWVPAVETEEDKKRWNEFLDSKEGRKEIQKIIQDVESEKELDAEQRKSFIVSRLAELAKSQGIGVRQWRLQMGAVPKSMGLIRNPDGTISFDEKNGTGFILHIEEVGLAEPQIVNALLRLRGKRGELTKYIQLWEDGGKEIRAGEKWWLVMSTNPPEEYGGGREPIDPALARGFDYAVLKTISPESYRLAADYYFTYKVGEKPQPKEYKLDIHNHPEIGRHIADVVGVFHNEMVNALRSGEKGRETRIIVTLDQMASVASTIVEGDFQKRDKKTGRLDLTKSLRELIIFYYLARLADQDLKEAMIATLDKILGLSISKNELKAIKKSEEVLKSGGKELPPGVVLFEGKILTRKEVFDILVERASMTAEERAKLEAEEIERKKRESQRIKYEIEDVISKLKENPKIPEDLKKLLE
jgi:MoxR-like ATPase